MLRKSFCLIVIAMLVGCTNTPISPTHINEAPIITEPTTVEQIATDSPSSESSAICDISVCAESS